MATALLALWTAHASPLERFINKRQLLAAALPAAASASDPLPSVTSVDTQEVKQPAAPALISEPTPNPALTPAPVESQPVSLRSLNGALQGALSMIETGDNDHAIGRAGEVSRYQIMPAVWKHYSDSRQYRRPETSLEVAQQHWAWLYDYFKKSANREPTEFDMYVLWNTRHGYYSARGFDPSRLSAVVRDRAQRFSNLVEDAARREAGAVPAGTHS